MKIVLIRHTSVDVPKGVCYGQTDVPLSATFEKEALAVKEQLSTLSPDVVFTSPSTRCVRLARFCGFGDAIQDNRLKELNFGDWEGQQWAETDMSVWKTDWVNPPAPNGESFMQMYGRVVSFFNDLKEKPCQSVVVFTHGGVINCARVYFGQAGMKDVFAQTPQYGEFVGFNLQQLT